MHISKGVSHISFLSLKYSVRLVEISLAYSVFSYPNLGWLGCS